MQIDIDTHDIDVLARIFERRALWMVPTAVVAGHRRAERHVRRRRQRYQGQRHYRRKPGRHPTPALIAHYINHILFLRLAWFWGRKR